MQANMKTLTAVQLMQEPGILSFIEGSKNTPILDLFVAVKTAYPNLQGSFVDLRAAYNAAVARIDSERGRGYRLIRV